MWRRGRRRRACAARVAPLTRDSSGSRAPHRVPCLQLAADRCSLHRTAGAQEYPRRRAPRTAQHDKARQAAPLALPVQQKPAPLLLPRSSGGSSRRGLCVRSSRAGPRGVRPPRAPCSAGGRRRRCGRRRESRVRPSAKSPSGAAALRWPHGVTRPPADDAASAAMARSVATAAHAPRYAFWRRQDGCAAVAPRAAGAPACAKAAAGSALHSSAAAYRRLQQCLPPA